MHRLELTGSERRKLEQQLKHTRDAHVYRRTLAVLECAQGNPIAQVGRLLRVDRRSVHRWIYAYCESRDPIALWDDVRTGRPADWTKECTDWLRALLQVSPPELGYFSVNWTVPLLQESLELCSGRRFSDDTIRRELRKQGYVWKRTRYVLAPDPEREKKKANPAENQAFSGANCAAG